MILITNVKLCVIFHQVIKIFQYDANVSEGETMRVSRKNLYNAFCRQTLHI